MNKIIYLDAAASYLKSGAVIDAQTQFLRDSYANSGRGVCARAVAVDDMVARVRGKVAGFMGADAAQIVFTNGTTDGMNQIVRMLNLTPDTVVVVSDLDHHSARLPFVMGGAKIEVCPLDGEYNIDVDNIPRGDVLVLTAMSNVMGAAQKVPEIVRIAREKNPNVIVVVDAAQYVVHNKIDVKKWDADFVCWSGHKIGADTGVGIMYVKNPEKFNPAKFGGGMVRRVLPDDILLIAGPEKFEAGTLPLTQIAGLGVAIDEIENNRPNLDLIKYMYDQLVGVHGIRLLSARSGAVLSFVVDGMHPLDFGALLGARNVCVRVGNMCATWIHERLGVSGSVRISVGSYNTIEEAKAVVGYIKDIIK